MQRRDCIEIPAKDVEQVELTSLHRSQCRVGSALGEASSVERLVKESIVEAVAHKAVSLAKLLN